MKVSCLAFKLTSEMNNFPFTLERKKWFYICLCHLKKGNFIDPLEWKHKIPDMKFSGEKKNVTYSKFKNRVIYGKIKTESWTFQVLFINDWKKITATIEYMNHVGNGDFF